MHGPKLSQTLLVFNFLFVGQEGDRSHILRAVYSRLLRSPLLGNTRLASIHLARLPLAGCLIHSRDAGSWTSGEW